MFTGLLQPTHLIILLAVALIFLGPKRLPNAARALGEGLREFKDSVSHEGLPEAGATTHEETHTVQHDDTAPVPHEDPPPVA